MENSNQANPIDFVVFPNPCGKNCYLQLEDYDKEIIKIQIKDLHGKIYFHKSMNVKENGNLINLENYNLIPNIYIVTMQTSQKTYSKRFVKQ